MARRRNWKPFPRVPTDEEKPSTEAINGMGLLAPVRCIADIVEAFASVKLINESVAVVTTDDLLRAVEVVAINKGSHADNYVVFRTASRAFPLGNIPPGCEFAVAGSNYRMSVIDGEFDQVAYRFTCERSSAASLDKIQASAARVVGSLINEDVDGESPFFIDAVSSRFLYFTRTKTGVKIDDSEGYRPPARPWKPEFPPTPITPFVRPQFNNLDDLLHAFATHAVRAKGGKAYTVGPMECPPAPLCQPLVFCHTPSLMEAS